jgi:hypothetical protein
VPLQRTSPNPWAIVSLVAAVVSMFVLAVVLGPLAVITGIVGVTQGGRGRGLAIAGIVIGTLATLIAAIVVN